MNKKRILNIVLLVFALALMFGPMLTNKNSDFSGTDNKARDLINEVAPDYKPWTENRWKPQSSEVESYLFAMQAGIGSLIIGYIIGYGRGKKAGRKEMPLNKEDV